MQKIRERNCLQCLKLFTRKNVSQINWETGNKFCSRRCAFDYMKLHGLRKGKNSPSYRNGKIEKKCIICDKTFYHWACRKNAKCCSLECTDVYHKTAEYKAIISKINSGRIMSEEQKRQISQFHKGRFVGENNPSWKGNNVGYRAMHAWVNQVKGKPTICEHCGIDSVKEKKRLCWANKSHNYLREPDDWMRLCYRCHRKYDFPNEKHL